jgi:response regulator of citrate/malate metabolism
MQKLYESMKINVSEILSTPQYMKIIDFIFKKPIFTASEFIENTGVSRATGYKYLEILMKA